MRAMLTGHREVSFGCLDHMKELILELASETDSLTIISGGNLGTKSLPTGADRMWALAAFELGVPYEIYVPCGYGQHYYGNHQQMYDRFVAMLSAASNVVLVGDLERPFDWRNNFARNDRMVQDADHFVVCSYVPPRSLLVESRGGTSHCVKSMVSHGVKSVDWVYGNGTGYERGYELDG